MRRIVDSPMVADRQLMKKLFSNWMGGKAADSPSTKSPEPALSSGKRKNAFLTPRGNPNPHLIFTIPMRRSNGEVWCVVRPKLSVMQPEWMTPCCFRRSKALLLQRVAPLAMHITISLGPVASTSMGSSGSPKFSRPTLWHNLKQI